MLADIRDRVKTAPSNPFKSVQNCISLAAAQDNPPQQVPAAYIYPSAAASDGAARANGSSQRIITRFGVAIFLRSAADPTGAAKIDPLEQLYTHLRATLIGWVPDPANGQPVAFSRGYLAGFDQGGVWWAEEYTVTHYHR